MYGGVDGCRAGWLLIVLPTNPTCGPAVQVMDDFVSVLQAARDNILTLCDMPIGLPDGRRLRERQCDRLARGRLGHRSSTVFPVPTRPAIYCSDWEQANRVQRRLTGRGISRQSWGIAPRIREVDRALRADTRRQETLRESHPELGFAALNGGEAVARSKHQYAGIRQRLDLLRNHVKEIDGLLENWVPARSGIGADDVLDAAVMAVHARLGVRSGITSLPVHAEYDAAGLRMEMVTGVV